MSERFSEIVERTAAAIREADERGTPLDTVRDLLGGDADVASAYAVQRANVQHRLAAGGRLSGRKVGLTGSMPQRVFGVDRPVHGALFADRCLVDGAELDAADVSEPQAEAEVAFVLGASLDRATHTVVDLIDAVAYVLPAIEVVDSRVGGWNFSAVDLVADNVRAGYYVLGARPRSLADVNVRDVSMSMTRNGADAVSGSGEACLGNPLNALRWLADEMVRTGTPLRAGDCVMSGSLGALLPFGPGDHVVADFGDFGAVSVRVAER